MQDFYNFLSETDKQKVRVAVAEIAKMLPVNRPSCSQGEVAEIISKYCFQPDAAMKGIKQAEEMEK